MTPLMTLALIVSGSFVGFVIGLRWHTHTLRFVRDVVERNHQWHKDYDDTDGYIDSELYDFNESALRKLEWVKE